MPGTQVTADRDTLLRRIYDELCDASKQSDFLTTSVAWREDDEVYAADGLRLRHQILQRLDRLACGYALSDDRSMTAYVDRHWHSLLRILYMYAILNPRVGFVPRMVQVACMLFHTLCSTRDAPTHGTKAWEAEVLAMGHPFATEADAFWCFSLLMGDFREVYDLGMMDTTSVSDWRDKEDEYALPPSWLSSGLCVTLQQCSATLRDVDPTLWTFLAEHSLDPQWPWYSYDWVLTLFAGYLPEPMVLEIWDVLFAESSVTMSSSTNVHIDMLVDLCCAMLMVVRDELLHLLLAEAETDPRATSMDLHARGMALLRSYPIHSARPIISMALQLREQRHASLPPVPTEAQRRASRLQERLAASVQRGLQSPSQRSLSGPASDVSSDASQTRVDEAADSTPTRRVSSGRSPASQILQRYSHAIQDSDTIASVSKAGTNLAAKALAWRKPSTDPWTTPERIRSTTSPRPPSAPTVPDLPMPVVVDSPDDRDQFAPSTRSSSTTRYSPDTVRISPMPSLRNDIDDSASFSLPSLHTAARLGLLPTASPDVASTPVFASQDKLPIRRSAPMRARRTPSQASDASISSRHSSSETGSRRSSHLYSTHPPRPLPPVPRTHTTDGRTSS